MAEKTVHVGILGLGTLEKAVVHTLLSRMSDDAVNLVPYRLNDERGADVLLIDAASDRARAACRVYQQRHPLPAYLVGIGAGHAYPTLWELPRPMSAGELGNVLDDAVQRILEAGDDADPECEYPDKSVLVADGDAETNALLRDALKPLVGRVETASSGAVASELAALGAFDVVILDAALDHPSAFAICQTAKSSSSASVILMLSPDASTDRAEAQMAGCDTFIIRPVNEFILREIVAEYLDVV